ncbi:MAG: hypothetical protein LBD55_12350, partial [Treponema sp.]|nr:hypothetical protein [Treponema sp.]
SSSRIPGIPFILKNKIFLAIILGNSIGSVLFSWIRRRRQNTLRTALTQPRAETQAAIDNMPPPVKANNFYAAS